MRAIVAVLASVVIAVRGWRKDNWSPSQAIVYGLVATAALLVTFDYIWWKPDAPTSIHSWLERAGYSVRVDPTHQGMKFVFKATDKQSMVLTIYQESYEGAPVYITAGLDFTQEKQLNQLSSKDQDELVTNIQLALLSLGVGFPGFGAPLQRVQLEDPFMFDGTMTEREFIEKTFRMSRAISSADRLLYQKLSHLP